MAEKILQTRIINKNADLGTWNSSDLILKKGEIALAKITQSVTKTSADGQSFVELVPTYVMKVGDGEKTFSQLNFLAAPASDVHQWAKKATLDYNDLPETLRTEIDNLQAAVGGEGSVAQAIATAVENAVNALDHVDVGSAGEGKFVTAVTQEDGKVTVNYGTITISDVEGLTAALAAKVETSVYSAKMTEIDGSISTLTTDVATNKADIAAEASNRATAIETAVNSLKNNEIAAAQTAANNAQTAADDAQDTADEAVAAAASAQAQADKGVADAATAKGVADAAAAAVVTEREAREQADNALAEDIADLEERIGDVANVMNFKGVVASDPANITSGYNNGDVVIYGDKEYVFSTEDNKFHEFGDASGNAAAVSELESRLGTAEGKIQTIENTYATDADLETAVESLEGKITAEETRAKGVESGLDTRLGTVETDLSTAKTDIGSLKTTVGGTSSGLVKDVADLQSGKADKTQVASDIASAKEELQGNIDTVDGNVTALTGRVSTAEGKITTLEGNVATAQGNITTLQGDITTINNTISTLATKSELNTTNGTIADIQSNYTKVVGNQLMLGDDVIIFDCGGAAE